MNLSVVIVTHNSGSCIGRCVDAVRERLRDPEIIVVDNASADSTAALVRTRVRFILLHENIGFGRACNVGAALATNDHLFFLNPDVELERADLSELERVLSLRPFGLVGAAVATNDGPQPLRLAERHWLADYVENTLSTLWPREIQRPDRRPVSSIRTWLSGAMLLADRQQFLALGGFDERFFMYYEDRDLSARYRDAGLPLRTTDAIVGVHTQGGSSASDDLRVAPLGWAFLGWLQYVYLHAGPRDAALCARLGLRTLHTMRDGLALLARVSGENGRVARKCRQITTLLAFLGQQARNGADKSFCPDARRLVGAAL